MNQPVPIRQPCPPGACNCGREALHENSGADQRILLLTRSEEKRMLERLENLQSLEHLRLMQQRMEDQLGIRMTVEPGFNEVRSMRGIQVLIEDQLGLCRKTRQSIPTAIRRSLEKRPEIAFELLNSYDLLRDT